MDWIGRLLVGPVNRLIGLFILPGSIMVILYLFSNSRQPKEKHEDINLQIMKITSAALTAILLILLGVNAIVPEMPPGLGLAVTRLSVTRTLETAETRIPIEDGCTPPPTQTFTPTPTPTFTPTPTSTPTFTPTPTPTPSPTPLPPFLFVVSSSSDRVELRWTDPIVNRTDYIVFHSLDNEHWQSVVELPPDSRTWIHANLACDTEHWYYVAAIQGEQMFESNRVNRKTSLCPTRTPTLTPERSVECRCGNEPVRISDPCHGQLIHLYGSVDIVGAVYRTDIVRYEVHYRQVTSLNGTPIGGGWQLIGVNDPNGPRKSAPVGSLGHSVTLITWTGQERARLAPGFYQLSIKMFKEDGQAEWLLDSCLVTVEIR